MTVIASWGGAGSNAYVDHTAANSIITTTVVEYSDWTSASTATRNAAIIQAARDIDAFNYLGIRWYHDQNLEFPRELRSNFPWNRVGTTDPNSLDVEHARMKRRVEEASALQALFILRNGGRNEFIEAQASGIAEQTLQVGPVRETVKYGQGSGSAGVRGGARKAKFAPEAYSLLSDYREGPTIFRG